MREIENIANGGAAKRVDALRVITDHGDLAVGAQCAKNARLQRVGILILIHQHVIVERADLIGDRRRLFQQQRPRQQQVVVIQEIAFRLAPHVIAEEPLDVAGPGEKVRPLFAQQVHDGALGIHLPRIHGLQRFGTREAWCGARRVFELGVSKGGTRDPHQIRGIGLIEDREVGRQSGGGPKPAQQPMGHAVEGAAGDLMRGRAHEPLTASQHLLGGAPGKGEEQNAAGGDAASYKVGHPMDQRPGFPRAGPGYYKEGGVAVAGGGGLGGIQGGPVHRERGRGDHAGCGDVDPWGLSHARSIEARGRGCRL